MQLPFEKDSNGNYIGYHCEGGETFELSGGVKLTLDTLEDDRLLFISNTPNAGWQHDDARILKVVFKVNKEYPTDTDFRSKSDCSYTNLSAFTEGDKTRHFVMEDSILDSLTKQGYNLFTLDDPTEQLPEGFITNPKQHVISIEEYGV